VRIAVAIDTHDREIIVRIATQSRGTSGEMILDMMLDRVEQRFNGLRAPEPVQWLADNGSAYAAADTIDFATTLNLVPCLTPVRSPEKTVSARLWSKPSSEVMPAKTQGQMPPPSSSSCQLASRIATTSTRIRGNVCDRQESS
jgi:transposase InsO family protein